MKKIIFLLFIIPSLSNATELVCQGKPQLTRDSNPVFIDCKSKEAVMSVLTLSVKVLKQRNADKADQDLCQNALNQAQSLHPAVGMSWMHAWAYFRDCNSGLGKLN